MAPTHCEYARDPRFADGIDAHGLTCAACGTALPAAGLTFDDLFGELDHDFFGPLVGQCVKGP